MSAKEFDCDYFNALDEDDSDEETKVEETAAPPAPEKKKSRSDYLLRDDETVSVYRGMMRWRDIHIITYANSRARAVVTLEDRFRLIEHYRGILQHLAMFVRGERLLPNRLTFLLGTELLNLITFRQKYQPFAEALNEIKETRQEWERWNFTDADRKFFQPTVLYGEVKAYEVRIEHQMNMIDAIKHVIADLSIESSEVLPSLRNVLLPCFFGLLIAYPPGWIAFDPMSYFFTEIIRTFEELCDQLEELSPADVIN